MWKFFLALTILLCSCDTQKKNITVPSVPTQKKKENFLFEVNDLSSPESFCYDSSTKKYFISNISGSPLGKDQDGYITRVMLDGTKDIHKFIINLNAPKGLTLHRGLLYVTDIDSVKGYHPGTGQCLFQQNLGGKFLNDIISDGKWLYVSDTKANLIFALNPSEKKVKIFSQDPHLKGPNGLALHPETQKLTVVNFKNGKIFELDKDGIAKLKPCKHTFKGLDGAAYDKNGNLYVSDFLQGEIYCIFPDGKVEKVISGLRNPADLAMGPNEKSLLVALMGEHRGVVISILDKKVSGK